MTSETTTTITKTFTELELSALRGSEKQCNWAVSIREKKLTGLLEEIEKTIEAKNAWDETCSPEGLKIGFMEPTILREKTALEILSKIDTAVFWIDKRDIPIKDICSRRDIPSDLIDTAVKLARDSQKAANQLHGYDKDDLKKYLSEDYGKWFEARGINIAEI